ncbi:hypothetical protein DPMN_070716 [Dreissena polymorpha]|uniref:Uncharacterized protein n=1 Tax=Dreissena polymorpha TaxID=45954 RepID=A0A9D4BVU1_DREPO|nr:hypothetical protein DPMN_070716 [Dreissena polymorpha]
MGFFTTRISQNSSVPFFRNGAEKAWFYLTKQTLIFTTKADLMMQQHNADKTADTL